MEFKMQTKKNTNQISKQLDQIQSLLKQKGSKPLNFIEAAQYLSISHSTLYKLTYQRKIPCHKPSGKMLYFFKHELDTWIAENGKEHSAKSDELKGNEDEDESG
jgi:excisionase family DNA binding protein